MQLNKDEVKQEFIRVCSKHSIDEVYVNFDKPFEIEHSGPYDQIYVVPRTALKFKDKLALRTSLNIKNKELGVYVIEAIGEAKEEAVWSLIQGGFKLLYFRGSGICFE